jgi:FixJ family two-component response regulator
MLLLTESGAGRRFQEKFVPQCESTLRVDAVELAFSVECCLASYQKGCAEAVLKRKISVPPSPEGPAILVVDDDATIVRALRRLLAPLIPTVGATSIAAAHAAIDARRRWTALILDVKMPGGASGWQVLARARDRDPLVPAMMLTGRSWKDLAKRSYDMRVIPYEKPITREHAHRFVRDALSAAVTVDSEVVALMGWAKEHYSLTDAERDVLEAALRGVARGTLVDGRVIAMSTHKTHVNRMLAKMGLRSLNEARDAVARLYFMRAALMV